MKKITLLLTLLTISVGFAQQQPYNIDFESGTPSGNAAIWYTFDSSPAPAEIVTNPDPDGVNTSLTTKVLKVVVGPTNAFYAGVNNRWEDKLLGTWKLDASVPSNLTISIDVNKNYIGTVGLKMSTKNGGAQTFQIIDQNVGNTIVDQWQTLTYTIPAIPPTLETDIAQIVVFVDWTQGAPDRQPGSTIYIDNIRFNAEKLTEPPTCSDGIQNGSETGVDCGGSSCAPCPNQDPLVAAPTPPARNAADVVSIYSNAYSNVTLSELPTSWSQLSTFTPVQITGNDTWKITGCEFIGMVTNYGSGVDLSTMENMHIDYWTPNSNPIGVKIVNTVNGGEALASLGTTTSGTWASIDIPMTDFSALSNKTKITQLLIDPTGPNTLFIDNFYFYKGTALGVSKFETSKIKMYPNPVSNELTIEANSAIQKIAVYNVLGQKVLSSSPKTNSAKLQTSSLQNGVYIIKTTINDVESSSKFIKN